ncbi:MAG: hypothetical protein KBC35_01685 [Candidatus Pacebacteria bacterium]|nr:hypothetical protein [Candidatus Paceibacterota bacterium]
MTLVEMVVMIGVYVVLMLAVTMSIFNLYQINAYSFAQTNEIDNARRGVTQWYRDVREMVVGEDGTYPVAIIDTHRFGYYSDTDQDDMVEYVEYVLATTTLSKYTYNAVGSPAVYDLLTPDLKEDLSYYVQNINQATSTFFYYDNAGNRLSSTSPIIDVRYIEMQLIINIDPIKSPGEFMLRSSVAPRNIKDNL